MKIPIIFAAGLAVILGGCENPWMKSITAPLFKDKPDGTVPGVTMTEEEAKNMADFGVPAIPATNIHHVYDAAGWEGLRLLITDPGNYVINLTGAISITSSPDPTFISGGITVSLRGGGSLSYSGGSNASLLYADNGQKFIIRDFTLQGDTDNGQALLQVKYGGEAVLKTGGKITGNTILSGYGGGVDIRSGGKFTMEDGEISHNTSNSGDGGGVYINGTGEFIMKGGAIKNNFATGGDGGGVYAYGGNFTMEGGEIFGNTSIGGKGGGVYINDLTATFEKTGGTIYGAPDTLSNAAGMATYGHAVYAAGGGKYRDDTVSDNISVSDLGVYDGDWDP
jgi:hypothetical protein